MMEKENHPCFTASCSEYARIHLPVAPECNLQCNYCLRKFCCANECRPGVTAKVMSPQEALNWYLKANANVPNLTVVGIAGPGDALANWDKVAESFKLIRELDNKIKFCLSTTGLLLADYAEPLAELGVGYVTVTLNSLEPEVSGRIYSFANYKGKLYTGTEAGRILLENQLGGIKLLKEKGVQVKLNFVAIPGINYEQALPVAQKAKEMDCQVMNIIPMLPVAGSAFEARQAPQLGEVKQLRETCSPYVRQMEHCRRCRADACGTLK